jgi:exodeoxyribonuclease V beta subunit
MSSTIQQLDPLAVPLHGSRLIEASAGTGKTFTLAMLYLRLILRHGGKSAFARHLMPPEILVVTFTNAATEELRDRIRRRLVEAAAVFRGQAPTDPSDELLPKLREAMADSDPAHCARRLELAAEWMDESAISTIHAWCYRMLREHAFDSANAFEQTLENDDAELLQQAAEDYWRTFLIGLKAELLESVLKHWPQPSELVNAIRSLLPLVEYLPNAGSEPAAILQHCLGTRQQTVATLKTSWRECDHVAGMETLFEQAVKDKAFKQNSLNKNHRAGVLDALMAWLDTPDQVAPSVFNGTSKSWRRMSSLEISEIWNEPAKAPVTDPACRALADLHATLQALPDPFQDLLTHATHWLKHRVENAKRQRSIMTQNDLLIRLDAALQGECRERLAAAIRAQFPFALVDEFQDTDPIQYRIFNAIYDIHANSATTGFFMIGDPKQAIYAFRGADIHTYLIARTATQGRHYTLPVNYRSSTDLIEAVNTLFEHGERTAARGAFLFREPNGNPVPFHPVRARPQAGRTLMIDGQPCTPLRAWIIECAPNGKLTKEAYRERTAEATARTIANLLQLGQQGRARLPVGQDGERPLEPSDLAVLVNNRGEADAIRAELRRLDVASVYLSERGNVFETAIARDLAILLRAIANPFDDRLMRQALATSLLGQPLADLDRLNSDELYWEAQGERFRDLHGRWRRQGLLPMLYRLTGEFQIAARLLGTTDGERAMTDLLHLGELLQRASEELDGEQALVRFLEDAIAEDSAGETPEARQLRLESDARLVRVVTIHKSKGLEYPLVFLPFIANCRRTRDNDLPLKTHDAAHQLQVHLGGDAAIVEQADRERLGEDLRKLYVALTRARYANWLGLGPTSDLAHSALGYLLGLDGAGTGVNGAGGESLSEQLRQLSCVTLIDPPDADPEPYRAQADVRLESARPAPDWRPHAWWISSYSALSRGAHLAESDAPDTFGQAGLIPAPDSAETASEETAREETIEARVPDTGAATTPAAIKTALPLLGHLHDFPHGGRYGTFLHGLLQWAATQRGPTRAASAIGQGRHGFAAALDATSARRRMLAQRCALRRLDDWVEPLDAWLTELLDRTWYLDALALPGGAAPSLRLTDLDSRRYQVELEFWIEGRGVDLRKLDQLIIQHTLDGIERPQLATSYLNGMLKGFIDLALEHQGRYYVLDWKSNWLGPDNSAYTPEAMRAAIIERRYDLQYVLYLLALHRQLRARLPNYDYDRHLGGAIYVFLRGGQSKSQGLFMDRPPRALIESLDRLFAGV